MTFSGIVCTIFGATGFMGRVVASSIGATGTQMIFPVRCDWNKWRDLKVTGELGQLVFAPDFQLYDDEAIAKAVKHSHVVINLIGHNRKTRFTEHQVNVEGAARIAKISKEMGVEKFIHISALNGDREHEGYWTPGGSEFLKTKFLSEQAVRDEFPEAIIFRPSDVYGTGCDYFRLYLTWYRNNWGGNVALVNAGKGVYKQPVYVGDIAQAIQNIVYRDAGEPGQTYQAAGPHRYELADLMEYFLRGLGRSGVSQVTLPSGEVLDVPKRYNKVTDLKYSLSQYLVCMRDKAWRGRQLQCWERVEREAVSDVVSPYLPTLEDLDVTPTTLESRFEYDVKPFWMCRKSRSYRSVVEKEIEQAPYTVPQLGL